MLVDNLITGEVFMKIEIDINGNRVIGRLNDTKTSKDFIAELPLTVRLNDLFRREKYAELPHPLSTDAKREYRYKLGQIAYWSPSKSIAIFYKDDGETIPPPGIIVMGQIESGVNLVGFEGSAQVTIKLAD